MKTDLEQLTVRTLIERLQQLIAERPAIADMAVEHDDCGRCGCCVSSPVMAISVGPSCVELGADIVEWVRCGCGHELVEHKVPGAECLHEGCRCLEFGAPCGRPVLGATCVLPEGHAEGASSPCSRGTS